MFIKKILGQRGDTIVEVILAIGVISAVLGGAYVTTNKSLQASRGAQERSDATKLVESQFEQLKQAVAKDSDTVFGAGTFCLVNTTVVTASDAKCNTVTAKGAVAGANQLAYKLEITRSGNVFTIVTTWERLGGNTNNVTMSYKVYE